MYTEAIEDYNALLKLNPNYIGRKPNKNLLNHTHNKNLNLKC